MNPLFLSDFFNVVVGILIIDAIDFYISRS